MDLGDREGEYSANKAKSPLLGLGPYLENGPTFAFQAMERLEKEAHMSTCHSALRKGRLYSFIVVIT